MAHVLIACDLSLSFRKKLEEAGFTLSFLPGKEPAAPFLKGVDALFIGARFRFSAELLAAADSLRAISFCGAGVGTYVDQEAATRSGIAVMNAPGVNAVAVAEYAISFLLALRKFLVAENNGLKKGALLRTMNFEIRGMTAGILGMGHVGSRIAAILGHGFGAQIIYHGRSRKPDVERSLGGRFVSFETLLAESDALFLALPETDGTKGIIGAVEFARMKNSALLINVARPGLVDGHALREALTGGIIRAAAFDGYYLSHPYPRTPEEDSFGLLSLSDQQFLCTPHLASRTQKAWDDLFERAADNLIEFFATGDCVNIVNPDYRAQVRR